MNNEFMNYLAEHKDKIKNVSADDVRESLARADEQEKALLIAIHGLFAKKRKSTSDMLRAVESMDMILDIIKHVGPEDVVKDMPDNKLIAEKGRNLVSAIDGVISALQTYGLADEEFNEAVRQDCDKKEKFKQNLKGDE